jgi:hypothetical protein
MTTPGVSEPRADRPMILSVQLAPGVETVAMVTAVVVVVEAQ